MNIELKKKRKKWFHKNFFQVGEQWIFSEKLWRISKTIEISILYQSKQKVVICSQNQTIIQLIFFGKIVSNENKKHVINCE